MNADHLPDPVNPGNGRRTSGARRVDQVRAGRSLRPPLAGRRALRGRAVVRQRPRDERTAGRRQVRRRMSWGQYGGRVGVPRILALL